MYTRYARTGLNLLNTSMNPALKAATGANPFIQARVSASQMQPLTLANTSNLHFSHTLPTSPSLFAKWQTRSLSSTHSPQSVLASFDKQANSKTPTGMSAAEFFSLPTEMLLINTQQIIDSFFPIDPPKDSEKTLYINDAIRQAFAANPKARKFQQDVFLKTLNPLGFVLENGKLCLKSDFKASDCVLLTTPNGRNALAQIIRSMSMLGNNEFATEFQSILLAIGTRYRIPASRMSDIALATDPEYWQKRDRLKANELAAGKLIDALLKKAPKESFLNLEAADIPDEFLAPTGNLFCDFILGYRTNQSNHSLKALLINSMANSQSLLSNAELLQSVFPTSVSKDSSRCFRSNPLLRKAQRMLARAVLNEFHLQNLSDKEITLNLSTRPESLSWLQEQNGAQRQVLLQIIQSLTLLQNHQFATKLKNCVFTLMEQYYTGKDKYQVLMQFHDSVPALPLPPQALTAKTLSTNQAQFNALLKTSYKTRQPEPFRALSNLLQTLTPKERYALLSFQSKTSKNTPLMKALANHRATLTKLLISAMAGFTQEQKIHCLGAQNIDGNYPMSLAARSRKRSLVDELLKAMQGMDEEDKLRLIDTPVKGLGSPLCIAAKHRHFASMKLLLEVINNLSPNAKERLLSDKSPRGYATIIECAKLGHKIGVALMLDCMKYLPPYLQNKFLNLTTDRADSALMMAAKQGHTDIVQILLEAAKPFDDEKKTRFIARQNIDGDSALGLAARHGMLACVKSMLAFVDSIQSDEQKLAVTTLENNADQDPFKLAQAHQHQEVANQILNYESALFQRMAGQKDLNLNSYIFTPSSASKEFDPKLSGLYKAAQRGDKATVITITQNLVTQDANLYGYQYYENLFDLSMQVAKENNHFDIASSLSESLLQLQKHKATTLAKTTTAFDERAFFNASQAYFLRQDSQNLLRLVKGLPNMVFSKLQLIRFFEKRNSKGDNLIEAAIIEGNIPLLVHLLNAMMLIDNKALRVKLIRPEGARITPAFELALRYARPDCIKVLTQFLSEFTPKVEHMLLSTNQDQSPLATLAAEYNQPDALFHLLNNISTSRLQEKIDFISPEHCNTPPLCKAAQIGNNAVIESLLNFMMPFDKSVKSDILNRQDKVYGFTPLWAAVANQQAVAVISLLDFLPYLDKQQQISMLFQLKDTQTPLMAAVINNNHIITQDLLAAAIRIDDSVALDYLRMKNAQGQSALSLAAELDNKKALTALLKTMVSLYRHHNIRPLLDALLKQAELVARNNGNTQIADFLNQPIAQIKAKLE